MRQHRPDDLDRLELSPRVERARPANSNVDLQELRLRGHRRPLVAARPARPVVERAEAPLLIERVDLDHDPVDLVVELEPSRLPLAADLGDGLDRLVTLGEGARAKAALAKPLERRPVPVGRQALAMA